MPARLPRPERSVAGSAVQRRAMPGAGSAIPRHGKESCSVAAPSRPRKANVQVVERWTRGQKQQGPTTRFTTQRGQYKHTSKKEERRRKHLAKKRLRDAKKREETAVVPLTQRVSRAAITKKNKRLRKIDDVVEATKVAAWQTLEINEGHPAVDEARKGVARSDGSFAAFTRGPTVNGGSRAKSLAPYYYHNEETLLGALLVEPDIGGPDVQLIEVFDGTGSRRARKLGLRVVYVRMRSSSPACMAAMARSAHLIYEVAGRVVEIVTSNIDWAACVVGQYDKDVHSTPKLGGDGEEAMGRPTCVHKCVHAARTPCSHFI